MFKIIICCLFFQILLTTSCDSIPPHIDSTLYDVNERKIPIVDGVIELDGFIAGGHFSERQAEAIQSADRSCDHVFTNAFNHFDRFRVVRKKSSANYDGCGLPVNETPFGMGYLYVFRPKIFVRVDPDDDVVEVDGADISGIEAPQHRLDDAFTSFNDTCFSEITKLKAKLGSKIIAAACGTAKSSIRMSYSPEHRMDLPNLTIRSKMKVYLRKNEPGKSLAFSTLPLMPRFSIELTDTIQAMAQAGPDQPVLFAVNFAGSISKIDIKTKRIIWEKNLTNPQPSSVRETTPLNTVAVSRDGLIVVAGGDNGYLALLDSQSGQKIRLFSCDARMFENYHYVGLHIDQSNRSVYSVARLSGNAHTSSGYNRMKFPHGPTEIARYRVTRWNLETGRAFWNVDLEAGAVISVGVTRDESLGYIIASDRVVLLKPVSGEVFKEFSLSHYEAPFDGAIISGASFSQDMRLLAVSAFSGIILIDTQSGKMLRRFRAGLIAELGNPEISIPNQRLRAFDAQGHLYEWDLLSGQLVGEGFNQGFSLSYNGPPNMPILSILNGQYIIKGDIQMGPVGGVAIHIPRLQPVRANERLCMAGADSDLPSLTIRKAGRIAVWATGRAP